MTAHHLVQINIALGKAPLVDLIMRGFTEQLDVINALAEAAPGFVWRWTEAEGDALRTRAFAELLMIVNLSVWTDAEFLKACVYKNQHGAAFRNRQEWFVKLETPSFALWWIPAGTIPTVREGKQRLEQLERDGPTAEVLTFRSLLPPPEERR